jgi:hypothetical protein
VSFKYRLTYTDGDDGGDFETAVSDWKVGHTFHTAEGRRLRIVQIIPEFELGPDSVYAAAWMVEAFEPV